MQVDVTGRELSLPDMGLIARNIRTRMVFNDLLRLQSVPGQDLTIESIDVGKIRLREAVVRYSLENTPSLLVENIQVADLLSKNEICPGDMGLNLFRTQLAVGGDQFSDHLEELDREIEAILKPSR